MLETSPSLSFFGENLTLLDLFHTKFSYDISMTLYTWRFSLKAYKPFSLSSRVVMLLHCRRVTPATFGGNFVTLQSTERVKQACVARIMFSVFQSSEKWERERAKLITLFNWPNRNACPWNGNGMVSKNWAWNWTLLLHEIDRAWVAEGISEGLRVVTFTCIS